MTHETKLGLVIGGLFIICFALILSNMDDEQMMQDQIAALESTADGTLQAVHTSENGRIPPQLVGYTSPALSNPTRSAQLGDSTAPAASFNDADGQAQPVPPSGQKVIAPDDLPVDIDQRQSPPPQDLPQPLPVTDAIKNRPLDVKPQSQRLIEQAARSADQMDALASADAPDAEPPTARQEAPRSQPRKVQVYVVAPKDNLTKIAKKVYGEASRSHIQAIIQANKRVLKDPNAIRIGQKLLIPIEPSAAQSTARLAQNTPPNPVTRRQSAKPAADGWVWYQVKPNDRYSKIARNMLGSSGRWKEIYELNKRVFPDPDHIRPGVRIKIPRR